jgi:hypothetical protein
MKAVNAPMKSVIAPKTNFIEVYVTAVPEISIAIGIKDTNPPGPSFLFNPMKKFNDEAHYGSLSDKWGITAFMDRKTPGGDDVMRYLSGGSTYPWKTMITLNLTEIENHAEVGTKIAKGFTKFCLDEKHNRPEKFVFRKGHYEDEPKPLNYYLMDKDCVAMLKKMYGDDDGSPPSKTLWSMEISSPTFLDVRRKVRKCWRLWTITSGICWIDIIIFAKKRGQLTRGKT